MLCHAPFLGITVDPSGLLTLCCATSDREYFKTHIDDVDDLQEFFLGDKYTHVRNIMKSEGIKKLPQCLHCWKAIDGYWTEINNYNEKQIHDTLQVSYLELTTSNTCNQTCVTCSSYFSSKWRKIESKFDRQIHPSFQLSDSAIDKVIKVLPGLKYLQIKGGEPFADKNNLKILKALSKVNPKCEVIITSNFQRISDEWYEVLKLLPNIKAGASIYGIDKTYDWIRGGSFEDTIQNLENFYKKTGNKVVINVCVSLYNIFLLSDILDYFKNKEYVSVTIFNNILNYPNEQSIQSLDPLTLKKIAFSELPFWHNDFENIRKVESFPEDIRLGLTNKFISHTEIMNSIRGFNIFDIQPKLANIYK